MNVNDDIVKNIIKNTYDEKNQELDTMAIQMYTFSNRLLTFLINEPGIFDRGPIDPIAFDYIFNEELLHPIYLEMLHRNEEKLKNTKHIILTLNKAENIERLKKRNRENEFVNKKTLKLLDYFNSTLMAFLIMNNLKFEIINCDDKTPEEIKNEIVQIIEKDCRDYNNEKN